MNRCEDTEAIGRFKAAKSISRLRRNALEKTFCRGACVQCGVSDGEVFLDSHYIPSIKIGICAIGKRINERVRAYY